MPDIIFARPRHEYESYRDFWRLVELSGFPIVHMDEIDAESENVYIFSTPATHWHDGTERRGWDSPRARIICYLIEWYADVDYSVIPGVEIWTPDAWWSKQKGLRYVPMGGHGGLRLDDNGRTWAKKYDVATLFAPSYRRYAAIGQLTANAVTIAPNGWGQERHEILSQSRCMVSVHQNDGLLTVAPQRWALAAAYSLPMITETLADPGVFTANYRLMSDLQHIGEFARTWLAPENARMVEDYGRSLHQFLCEHYTFRKGIEAHV